MLLVASASVCFNLPVSVHFDLRCANFSMAISTPDSPIFFSRYTLKGIYPEFQVIRGFSQKIPAGLLSYDQIHS